EEAERRREKEKSRVMRRAIISLSALLLITIGVLVFALWQMHHAREKEREANQAAKAKEIADDALKALKNKQDQALQHSNTAQAYFKQKKFDQAVQEWDESIKLDPDNPQVYSSKGYALMRLGKYPEAIETLKGLTSNQPKYIWGHYNLALAYSKANQPEL